LRTRFVRVGAQGLVGFEMHVAFDGKPEWAAKIADLVHTDETDLLGPSMALALHGRPKGRSRVNGVVRSEAGPAGPQRGRMPERRG
jgi:hypothetical protein